MSTPAQSGLYIVATPIGNLGDLSRRAEATLAAADIILVEDTRVTGKLLNHIGKKSRMMVYNDHKSAADREFILDAVRCKIVALVSDAGTPLISDPRPQRRHRRADPVRSAQRPLSVRGLPAKQDQGAQRSAWRVEDAQRQPDLL